MNQFEKSKKEKFNDEDKIHQIFEKMLDNLDFNFQRKYRICQEASESDIILALLKKIFIKIKAIFGENGNFKCSLKISKKTIITKHG